MMSYPFPHITHKRYQLTFLESVKLMMVYDGQNDMYDAFKAFFEEFFKISITPKQFDIKNADALRLRDSKSEERFKFSRNVVEVIIDGESYINFDTSLMPFISSFQDYLQKIGGDVHNLTIEKINLWPAQDAKATQNDLMNVIFSKNLLQHPSDSEGEMKVCEFKVGDSITSIVIRYGVIAKEDSRTLILDTVCNKSAKVRAEDIIPIAREMNQFLFDTYHWSVTPEVIKAMGQ